MVTGSGCQRPQNKDFFALQVLSWVTRLAFYGSSKDNSVP
jgi:hypothetical protein